MACPFSENELGLVSPRSFQPYRVEDLVGFDARFFESSIENSFPDIMERANFLNKFYQCFLCQQLIHKVRKLVVVGEKDSGKTSWANVLLGLIPETKVAVLTKEKVFGSSMIKDDTELLFIDEWNADMMSSDLVKTLLQGGNFAQSIKHKLPKWQAMNVGVFITCNQLPSFEEEDENVRRRLAIYTTKTLRETSKGAPKWIKENAFKCLIWMINFINSNINHIDKDERFYEKKWNESANARLKVRVSAIDIQRIQDVNLDTESSSSVGKTES